MLEEEKTIMYILMHIIYRVNKQKQPNTCGLYSSNGLSKFVIGWTFTLHD